MKPVSISVMSLNLRFGLADDGPHRWTLRSKALDPLLKAYPCDFYAFQEANDFQIDFLSSLLPEYGSIGRRAPAPVFWQNNVIFHHRNWQCVLKDHFYLSDTPDIPSRFRDSRWPRQCTWGLFENGATQLACSASHFDFDPGVQTRSAQVILKRLEEKKVVVPTILMGDFNASPASACHQTFTSKENGFHQAFLPPYQATHHDFEGRGNSEQIDWILYRGDIKVLSTKVISERFEGVFPSDHFPVNATLSLNSSSKSP